MSDAHEHALTEIERLEADNARLRQEVEEYASLTGRMSRLLEATATALKGDPGPLRLHDWSDLPMVAALSAAEARRRAPRDPGRREG